MPQEPDAQAGRGLVAAVFRLTGSLGRHVQAMGALAVEEGREASANALRGLVLLLAALVLGFLGYTLLVVFAAFAAAAITGLSWLWICGALALVHLALAAAALVAARERFRQPVFQETMAELRRDFEALGQNPPQP